MKTVFRESCRALRRGWMLLRRALQPRHALPCVGLVVVGGCLTFIITPDTPETMPLGRAYVPVAGELPTVVLDPGHGGKDEGTKWRGVSEQHLTLDLALRVEKMLTIAGFKTVMTRRDNTFVSLEERTRIANSHANAVFISLHFNSDPTTNYHGVETHFAREKEAPSQWTWIGFFNKPEPVEPDTSEDLAAAIQEALVARTSAKDRGLKQSKLYVMRRTQCPSVLIEGGFISNAFEAQMLANDGYRDSIARGIVEGLMQYHTVRVKESLKPKPRPAESQ